ncbi:MAG: sodium:proton antiporter NhaD [Bacteroidales bacterium]|nr:sodium:proton antiporter NhaD [Bacteroidales bacterium]
MFYVMIVLFVVGYACIALEHPLKVNKTAFALMLGVLIWLCYILTGPSIFDASGFRAGYDAYMQANPGATFVDFITKNELIEHLGDIAEILFYLMGAMTVVELIDSHGGFNIITDRITTKNKVKLLWILSFVTFFLSALLDNLTTAIVMVALLRKLLPEKKDRWFFGGMVILAANSGGAWSPIGDVTTIMLWIAGNISTGAVITRCFLPSLISMIIPLIIVSFVEKGTIEDRPHTSADEQKAKIPSWRRNLIFWMGIGALVFVPVFKTLTHLKPYMGIMLGLSVLWITTEIIYRKDTENEHKLRITNILSRIDLPSILFFLGILLAVAGLQSAGHLSMLAAGMDTAFSGNYYLIDVIIGALSSIVDNVPLVAGVMGMYDLATFPTDSMLWVFLSYCAGTGGSLLIIGSAAGVAVMGMEKIDFIWYLKHITPYALLGYLSGAGVYILMDKLCASSADVAAVVTSMPMIPGLG